MMASETVFHNPDYLRSHPLMADYATTLEATAARDYENENYFHATDIPSIDLDLYEISQNKDNECTSDAVVGIADLRNGTLINARLLLTELRMGYDNLENIGFSSLNDKYNHSCEILLSHKNDTRIDSGFVLIFRQDKVARMRNKFNRWSKEGAKRVAVNWLVYSPENFLTYLNYGEDIPQIVTPELEVKCAQLMCCNQFDSFAEFSNLCYSLKELYHSTVAKYRQIDISYLRETIKKYLADITFPFGEDKDYCILEKKEIEAIINA